MVYHWYSGEFVEALYPAHGPGTFGNQHGYLHHVYLSGAKYRRFTIRTIKSVFQEPEKGTVANTVPNFVRGALPLISGAYLFFEKSFLGDSVLAALVVGFCCMLLAFIGTRTVHETFGKDLDYIEEH